MADGFNLDSYLSDLDNRLANQNVAKTTKIVSAKSQSKVPTPPASQPINKPTRPAPKNTGEFNLDNYLNDLETRTIQTETKVVQEDRSFKVKQETIGTKPYYNDIMDAMIQGAHESAMGLSLDLITNDKYSTDPLIHLSDEVKKKLATATPTSEVVKELSPEQLDAVFGSIKQEDTSVLGKVKKAGLWASRELTNLVSDVPLFAVGGAIGGAAVKTGSKTLITALAKDTATEKAVATFSKKSLLNTANEAIDYFAKGKLDNIITKDVLSASKDRAIIGASSFGLQSAVKSPLEQQQESGQIDLSQMAIDTAIGAATGAVGGAILEPAAKVAYNKLKSESLVAIKKLTPKSVKQKLYIQSLRQQMSEKIYYPDQIQLQEGMTVDSLRRARIKYPEKLEKLHEQSIELSDDIQNLYKFEELYETKQKFMGKTKELIDRKQSNFTKAIEEKTALLDSLNIKLESPQQFGTTEGRLNSKIKQISKSREKLIQESKLFVTNIETKKTTELNEILSQKELKLKSLIKDKESKLSAINSEIKKITDSKEYQVVYKAKEMGLDPNKVISARGFIYDPDIAKEASELPDLLTDIPKEGGKIGRLLAAGKRVTDLIGVYSSDLMRNSQMIDQKARGFVVRNIFEPLVSSEDRIVQNTKINLDIWKNQFKKAGMVRPEGLAKNLTDKVAMSKYLESQKAYNQKVDIFNKLLSGEMSSEEIKSVPKEMIELVDFSRKYLDKSFIDLNAMNDKLNLDAIKFRKNYFHQIHDENFLNTLGMETQTSDILSLKTKTSSLASSKARTSLDNYVEDPIQAIQRYVSQEQRRLHGAQTIHAVEGLVEFMKPTNRAYFNNVLNVLKGGRTYSDIVLDEAGFGIGRGIRSGMNYLISKTSSGTIPGNIAVILLQPTTVVRTATEVGFKNALMPIFKGMDALGNFPSKLHDLAVKHSPEFRIRSLMGDLDMNFSNEGLFNKSLAKEVDLRMYEHSFAAGLWQAKKDFGMSDAEAIIRARQVANMTQDFYHKAFGPYILTSTLGKSVGQFGTFSFGFLQSFIKDLPNTLSRQGKTELAKQFTRLYSGMIATNLIAVSTGIPKPFDIPFLDVYRDKEGINVSLTSDPGALAPIVRPLAKYGYPMAYKTLHGLWGVMTNREDIEFNTKKGKIAQGYIRGKSLKSAEAVKELSDVVPAIALKRGLQIKKSLLGLDAVYNGYLTYGKSKIPLKWYDVPGTIAFGPTQTISAQEFFGERKKKSKK